MKAITAGRPVALAGLAAAMASVGCHSSTTPPCSSKVDCLRGKVCIAGTCKPVDDTSAAQSFCSLDTQCPADQYCAGGTCAPRAQQPAGSCTRNEDCPGQFCKSTGVCVDCLSSRHCNFGEQCRADGKCGVGEPPCISSAQCAGLVCNLPTGKCVQCVTGADCRPGQSCRQNACYSSLGTVTCHAEADCTVASQHCDLTLSECVDCTEDSHCSAGQHCTNGSCIGGSIGGNECTTRADCGGLACFGGTCQRCTLDAMCLDPGETAIEKICDVGSGACIDLQCHAPADCTAGLVCFHYRCDHCYSDPECGDGEVCEVTSGTCKARSGQLGESCNPGACAPGLSCLPFDSGSRCTRTCIASGAGPGTDCPAGFACVNYETGRYDGVKLCIASAQLPADFPGQPFSQLPGAACSDTNSHCQTSICSPSAGACARSCAANRDCNTGEICCADWADVFQGAHLCCHSDPVHYLPTGEICSSGSECDSGICWGTCSTGDDLCNDDSDCPGAGGCVGVCVDHCRSAADCKSSEACSDWPMRTAGLSWSGWVAVCLPKMTQGTLDYGATCANNGQCKSERCEARLCTTECAVDADCTGALAGKRCTVVFHLDASQSPDSADALCK
jgi:hypothetical protein